MTSYWPKAPAAVFSILVVCLVLSPIVQNWRAIPRDSFPLSYYPMFSKARSDQVRVTYLVGIDKQGRRYRISYRCAGTGGLNQVRKQILKRVADGDADQICRALAARVARKQSGPLAQVETVAIVTGQYRLSDYIGGQLTPTSLIIEASCPVRRNQT
jgi:hypothetical protein